VREERGRVCAKWLSPLILLQLLVLKNGSRCFLLMQHPIFCGSERKAAADLLIFPFLALAGSVDLATGQREPV
jgi:hypothetical protein